MAPSTRDRLIRAAFELFDSQSYEATTVEQIAAQAGVGRTTFFRHFGVKEDVLFPHHDLLLAKVDARLSTATPTTQSGALREAARIVLDHYIAEGETARRRYRLTSTVPAVRSREMAAVQRYQQVFARHIARWLEGQREAALRAELGAAAVITAHNHVLRNWLKHECMDIDAEFEAAMTMALRPLTSRTSGRTTVVITSDDDVESVLYEVRRSLTQPD